MLLKYIDITDVIARRKFVKSEKTKGTGHVI